MQLLGLGMESSADGAALEPASELKRVDTCGQYRSPQVRGEDQGERVAAGSQVQYQRCGQSQGCCSAMLQHLCRHFVPCTGGAKQFSISERSKMHGLDQETGTAYPLHAPDVVRQPLSSARTRCTSLWTAQALELST